MHQGAETTQPGLVRGAGGASSAGARPGAALAETKRHHCDRHVRHHLDQVRHDGTPEGRPGTSSDGLEWDLEFGHPIFHTRKEAVSTRRPHTHSKRKHPTVTQSFLHSRLCLPRLLTRLILLQSTPSLSSSSLHPSQSTLTIDYFNKNHRMAEDSPDIRPSTPNWNGADTPERPSLSRTSSSLSGILSKGAERVGEDWAEGPLLLLGELPTTSNN